jgi:PKD repeat protein
MIGIASVVVVVIVILFLWGLPGFDSDGNSPPVIRTATPNKNVSIDMGRGQEFYVTCRDPDGDSMSYTWKLDGEEMEYSIYSGTLGTKMTFTPNVTQVGTHKVKVKISDGSAETVHTWNVTVRERPLPNRAPTAVATVNAYEQKVGETFVFNAEGSYDPDDDLLNYEWTFGEGSTSSSTLSEAAYIYSSPGAYVVVLTVNDRRLSSTDTIIVTVTPLIDYLWKEGPLSDNGVSKVLVMDVDDDGDMEIVVGSGSDQEDVGEDHGQISIYDMETRDLEWSSSDIGAVTDFVIRDIDDDPAMEIIVGVLTEWTEEGEMSGFAYVYDGATHEEQWKSQEIGGVMSVLVGDADDDPDLEIVFGHTTLSSFDEGTYTFTLRGGVIVIDSDYSELWRSKNFGATEVMFVGDLDGDSSNELLFSTMSKAGFSGSTYNLSVVSWNGSTYREVLTRNDLAPNVVRVVDLDGDGVMEIIAAEWVNFFGDIIGNITVYDPALSVVWTKEDVGGIECLEVLDVDGDGELEIVAGGTSVEHYALEEITFDGQIFVLDTDGEEELKIEDLTKVTSIAIGDFVGNSKKEIALVMVDVDRVNEGTDCTVLVLDSSNHKEILRVPTPKNNPTFDLNSVDCDGDGKADILYGSNESGKGYLTVYKLN